MWWVDLQLFWTYGLGRAYTTSLRHRPKIPQGERVGMTYGETPFRTFDAILTMAGAKSNDTFLELGSGTGRLTLMAAKCWGLKSLGVECITPFVERANAIVRRSAVEKCSFIQADLFDISWSEADLLYITATTFTQSQLDRFYEKCGEIKRGAKLVSLTHSPNTKQFSLLSMDVLSFSWGPATVFVHQKK
ncbi:MAG: class I SAM-dependent methyltransferase [Myxococcota bacterium]|nr:class I SAM-dependent methyltransferase [Myxococcota bacterium]